MKECINNLKKEEKMAGYRSYTKEEIVQKAKEGKRIIALDTDGAGEDDTFYLDAEETIQDIQEDVLAHHDLEKMPENWSFEDITDTI